MVVVKHHERKKRAPIFANDISVSNLIIMTQTLIPFPTGMLKGFVQKAALYLPPEHRHPIMIASQSKTKPNPLLEKTKIIVLCILAAKQHTNEEDFQKDIQEAIASLELNEHEYALFDGFLGARQGMLLEFAKRGVSKERLHSIRILLEPQRKTR